MQMQQTLKWKAEVAGATLKCKSNRRYTVMQKQQAQHCNGEAVGANM
jgi:hypothetical protein